MRVPSDEELLVARSVLLERVDVMRTDAAAWDGIVFFAVAAELELIRLELRRRREGGSGG